MSRRNLRLALVLAAAAIASLVVSVGSAAAAGASMTEAPIGASGSNNWFITLKNEEPTKADLSEISLNGLEEATAIVPSQCRYGIPISGAIGCGPIEAGATLQLCYHGPMATGASLIYTEKGGPPLSIGATQVGAVASCPVAGFNPPAPPAGGGGSTPPAGGGSTGTGTGAAPATAAKLGKLTLDQAKGTARLAVSVPGAGTLKLSGMGVAGKTVKPKKAGSVNLAVKAAGDAAKTLREDGKVKLHLVVTFTPAGGSATKLKKTVTLKQS